MKRSEYVWQRALSALAICIVPSLAADSGAPAPGMWDLRDLYPTPEAWTAERDKIKAQAETLESYKGTLGKSAASMLKALSAISDVKKEVARLGVYASLKGDEDVRVAENQERVQSAQALSNAGQRKDGVGEPRGHRVSGSKKVLAFEAQSPELKKRFAFQLDNALRYAPHTLSAQSEGVLAAMGDILAQPDAIYSQLANGELPRPEVKLSDGTTEKLDQAAFTKYRTASNRADRKLVFDAFLAVVHRVSGHFWSLR